MGFDYTPLRNGKGAKNSNARFTEDQVAEIRRKHAEEDYNYRDLADEYDCHESTIGRIVRREVYY